MSEKGAGLVDIAKLFALAAACAVATTLLALTPREGEEVVVVFAPWIDEQTLRDRVWRSGGYATGEHPLGLAAASGDEGFFSNLRRNGALLVLSAERASALCGFEKRV